MLKIRKSEDRGYADHGWLKTHHSFSFAGYYDPENMGWGNLRVINDDYIAAGYGFGKHGHRNIDRKSTRLNSSHIPLSRMPSSA